MYYTTIEQSKNLLKLGLRPETADMYFLEITENLHQISMIESDFDKNILKKHDFYNLTPSWSANALLDLIPKSFLDDNIVHFWHISKSNTGYNLIGFGPVFSGKLIDVAYNAICYLLEKHII